jgi:hypothetical protein
MSPFIEKRETSVGQRTHYVSQGVEVGLDIRLDPQGKLNTGSAFIDIAAKDLGISKEELFEKIATLKPGEKLEWD